MIHPPPDPETYKPVSYHHRTMYSLTDLFTTPQSYIPGSFSTQYSTEPYIHRLGSKQNHKNTPL